MAFHLLLYRYQAMIRLALSYLYHHLPKLLVSKKYYLLNESEQLGFLYCIMVSIGYIVHIWDKSIVSLFGVL